MLVFQAKSHNTHIIVNIALVFKTKLHFLRFMLALEKVVLIRVPFYYLKASISCVWAAARGALALSRKW